jgi:hypothetical protein
MIRSEIWNPFLYSDEVEMGLFEIKGVFVDRTAIPRIELKERYVMDFEARALAKCLGVTVAWLFAEKS